MLEVKVKVWILDIELLAWEDSWTAALYNLGNGSWLALASGTAAWHAAIHCRDSKQVDTRCNMTDIPLPQSAILGLYPIARRLLLINRPRRDGTLSWCWYTAATGGIRIHDLAIASLAPYHSATTYHTPNIISLVTGIQQFWLTDESLTLTEAPLFVILSDFI